MENIQANPENATPEEFVKGVEELVKSKPRLDAFFKKGNKQFIQDMAEKLVGLAKNETKKHLCSREILSKTIEVTMHQQVLYCGNET